MKETQSLVQLVLKAVALAMGVAVVVLSILGTVPLQTSVMLLGIGLAALAVVALGQERE
jgi:hypothetical protein